MQKKLVDSHFLADLFGVPVGTVWSWTSRGMLPCYRITSRITRYDMDDVTAWAQSRKKEGR